MSKRELKRKRGLLIPKQDIVFQALFGTQGSEKILGGLLKPILREDVKNISLEANQNLVREVPEEKFGVLDIRANIGNKAHVNIEVQMADEHNMAERLLFYWARMYGKQLKDGDDYSKLKKTISILIVNYEISDLNNFEKAHTEWHMLERDNTTIIFFENIEIHIIEIPKILKNGLEEEKDLRRWIQFLDSPESEEVKMGAKEDKELEEAVRKLEYISGDEVLQRQVEYRLKCKWDKNSYENYKKRTTKALMAEKKRLETENAKIEDKKARIKTENAKIEAEKVKLQDEKTKIQDEKTKIQDEKTKIQDEKTKIKEEYVKIDKERFKIVKKLFEAKLSIEQIVQITGLPKGKVEKLLQYK